MPRKAKPKGTPISRYVAKFLKFWLPDVMGASDHTVRSYKGAFKSLISYMAARYGLAPDQICFESLDEAALTGYLSWLSREQGLKPSSVNTRIGALKSFANFVRVEDPAEAYFCEAVRRIKLRKVPDEVVSFIEIEAMEAMFKEASTRSLRDLAILQTLYASGARESEFLALKEYDVRFNRDGSASLDLVGKGSKARTVKVGASAAAALRAHMQRNVTACGSLFCNRKGEPLSVSGLAYIVNRYAGLVHKADPTVIPEHVHPHMFRHSIATHMLRAGVDLESIRLFLGHSSIAMTMVYAKSDPAAVSDAILVAEESLIRENVTFMPSDKRADLDRWLEEEYMILVS